MKAAALLNPVTFAIELLPEVVQNYALLKRFRTWQKEARKEGRLDTQKTVKVFAVVALAVSLMAASCPNDIRDFVQYCNEHPEEHALCDRVRPRPRPTEVPPTPQPSATPTSQPTVAPTSTPTTAPTATPTVSPTPTRPPVCVNRPGDQPVTVAYNGKCPSGTTDLAFTVPVPSGFTRVCAGNWGTGNDIPAWRMGNGSKNPEAFPLVKAPNGAYVQMEVGREGECSWIDLYGRCFYLGERLYPVDVPPDFERAPWTRNGYADPMTNGMPWCDEVPVPTPTPTVGTPTPAPGGSVGHFSLAFTNVSNVCRQFEEKNGQGQCTPDGAHRYRGVLLPQEKNVQNTCDRDHWHCSVEQCEKPLEMPLEEWLGELQEHRDTGQMCQWDEWIVASGIWHEFKVNGGGINVADPISNPYQARFTAPLGAQIEARGCMDAGAYSCPDGNRGERKPEPVDPEDTNYSEYDCRPEHRRAVPGAGGCGPWKLYEVKK